MQHLSTVLNIYLKQQRKEGTLVDTTHVIPSSPSQPPICRTGTEGNFVLCKVTRWKKMLEGIFFSSSHPYPELKTNFIKLSFCHIYKLRYTFRIGGLGKGSVLLPSALPPKPPPHYQFQKPSKQGGKISIIMLVVASVFIKNLLSSIKHWEFSLEITSV